MGDLGLRDLLRRRAAARRKTGRSARAPASVRRRRPALRGQLAALRARLVGTFADRVQGAAGPRRCAHGTRRPIAPGHHVRGGARAESRARDLRSSFRQRRCGRRAARRSDHLVRRLVVDLLHQRPGGNRGRVAGAGPASREPCESRAPSLRCRRRRHDHVRTDAARLRADPGDDQRMGLAVHTRR